MGYFLAFLIIFGLIALGIVTYYKLTDEGRLQDVNNDLEESRLQGKLLDSIEETRKVQTELHERVQSLRNK